MWITTPPAPALGGGDLPPHRPAPRRTVLCQCTCLWVVSVSGNHRRCVCVCVCLCVCVRVLARMFVALTFVCACVWLCRFSPVAQRSPTTPTSGADHTSMAPTPTSVATQSRYRDSSPHGSRRVGAGTGGGAPGDGATDASVVDSEIEIDVHAMEEQSLYGNDTNVRAQLGKLGFTTVCSDIKSRRSCSCLLCVRAYPSAWLCVAACAQVSGAGVARVSVLLRLEHAGGHREALRLPCVGADPCLVASLDRCVQPIRCFACPARDSVVMVASTWPCVCGCVCVAVCVWLCVCGCVAVWLCGCVAVWLCGCGW